MILSSLRERTRSQHEQIEQTVNLFGHWESVERYGGLLARFYGFYAPLERRLGQVPDCGAIGLDLVERVKTPFLYQDLLALGFDSARVEQLPECVQLPRVGDMATVLGCLYVLEGATLGGQVLRREIERRHGLDTESGCRFFASYRERVGERWMEFCKVLSHYASENPDAQEAIVSAAVDTFCTFDRWIVGGKAC
ncbi:biliverdin-producing heme oxygenase [Candidatus Laterigemmans baculatus]|uniref:biliverdin-producing heme oxygenase n=1 Tax=Candidatus Laterigemmans baculatus TaxID=2770505 RepID=UPI0013DAEDBF|nr:biliverdin-producing heme oxygenase [Candidatus Laterigemmans baculatus]